MLINYFLYTIIHIILFIIFINIYYEDILIYLLIPVSKQNVYCDNDYNIYENINYLIFSNNYSEIENYPFFQINFSMSNITYIIYYLVIVYILLYIMPVILLQTHLFITKALFKHEKKKIRNIFFLYVFLFLFIFNVNNYVNIYLIIELFLNTYQDISLYLFDLNFNLQEYIYIYIFVFMINYLWIIVIINYFFLDIKNKYIVIIFIFILMSFAPNNIYLYIIEIIYFVMTYYLINYIFIIIFYTKRVELEYK